MTDLREGFCPVGEDEPFAPQHIVESKLVRVEEPAMKIVQYWHETCRNCGASDDVVTVFDYSLPFEVSMSSDIRTTYLDAP